MTPTEIRNAVLGLRGQGHSLREISRLLALSRNTVRRILREPAGEAGGEPPPCDEATLVRLKAAFARARGNVVRVRELLADEGTEVAYSTLTRWVRDADLRAPPRRAGAYDFAPGQEMQHDTSPHQAEIAGRRTAVQTAALALCFSHMLFFQGYPYFRRFECKVFLTEALKYFEGACARCMIDNTHLVVLAGSGKQMVPVPEMAAFGERFGFEFVAHAIGHANRSARVERPFDYIENNFFAGRRFADFNDLNAQARAWCDKVNATVKRHLHASPRELFAMERQHLVPLPAFVPEVYQLHERIGCGSLGACGYAAAGIFG
jgi:transposase